MWGGPEAQLRRLATDDNLEIKLRRLSSYVYETRTGDQVGAASMLAVQPPGAGLDLAPTWLVTDATAHSKAEYQRTERVGKTRGGGAEARAMAVAAEQMAAEAAASLLASMAMVVGKPEAEAEVVVAVAASSPRAERQFVWAPPVVGRGPIHADPPGQGHPDGEFEVARP